MTAKLHLQEVAGQLQKNMDGIRYGEVTVTLKIHDGLVTAIVYSTTKNTREDHKNGGGT
jgi:hypothetical protein